METHITSGDHMEAKRGSKQEVMCYLENEIGEEVEIAWNTSMFFFEGILKTKDMGTVLKYLAIANLI